MYGIAMRNQAKEKKERKQEKKKGKQIPVGN
jgi:hypothetical protein